MEGTDQQVTGGDTIETDASPSARIVGYLIAGVSLCVFGAIVLSNALGSSSPLSPGPSTTGMVVGGGLVTAGNLAILVAVVAKGVQLGMDAHASKSPEVA